MTKAVDELLLKRGELADRLAAIKAEMVKTNEDLGAIDRVLLLLDPSFQRPSSGKPRRANTSTGLSRGELSDSILEVLRDHGNMTAAQCADQLASLKGIKTENVPRLKSNVAATLVNLTKRNRVRRIHVDEVSAVMWQIAR